MGWGPFQGVHEVKTILIDYTNANSIINSCLFHSEYVTMGAEGTKAKVSKTAWASTWIKGVLHWESLCSPLPHIHSRQLPDSSENILDEAIRIISFIKSGPLNTVSLNILCDEMGGVYKALLVHIYKYLKISLYNTAAFVASWTSHFFFF